MKISRQLIYGHLSTLFLGGLIYILFRSEHLIMFRWFDLVELPFQNVRTLTLGFINHLPNWLIYSLPDGLWIFSYMSLILFIWKNRITFNNIIWIVMPPVIVIMFEIGQFMNIVQGTFDYCDIAFYIIGTILPIALYTELLNFKKLNYEKSY